MKHDLATAWARLKGALHNPNRTLKPGTCLVKSHDLELLLAEVQQLSNEQLARYLIRIVIEELRNGDEKAAALAARPVESRRRRNHPVHRAHRAATDCGVAALETTLHSATTVL